MWPQQHYCLSSAMKVWQFCIFKFKNKFYWVIGHMKKRLSLICQLVNRVCWDHELAKNSLWADRVTDMFESDLLHKALVQLTDTFRVFEWWKLEFTKFPCFMLLICIFIYQHQQTQKQDCGYLNPQNKRNVGSDAFIIEKNIKYNRVRGYFLKPLYTFYTLTIQREMTVKYGLH